MNEKMTILGIGPKMAVIVLPYFILTIILSTIYPQIFNLGFIPRSITVIAGVVALITGIVFYIFTVKTFFKEYKTGKLITSGTFSMCKNPIYCTFILFILPSVSLLINSWLALTSSLFLYILFKVYIHNEYDYLRDKFGNEFIEYDKRVNEILPFPK